MLCFIVGKELKSSNVVDSSFIYVIYAYARKVVSAKFQQPGDCSVVVRS